MSCAAHCFKTFRLGNRKGGGSSRENMEDLLNILHKKLIEKEDGSSKENLEDFLKILK